MTDRSTSNRALAGLMLGLLLLLATFQVARGTGAGAHPAAVGQANPVLLGVNLAGDYHLMYAGRDFYEWDALYRALDVLGVQFIDNNWLMTHYFKPLTESPEKQAERLRRHDRLMQAHGLKYVLNTELSNWTHRLEFTPGTNELENHGDGTHRWDFRREWIDQLLPPARPGAPALIGINYDEADHMLLSNNAFMDLSGKANMPFLADTTGLSLEGAFDRLSAKLRWIRVSHFKSRLPIAAEFGFPDMFHLFARAGWVLAPKMLKENMGTISLCGALGAALEYQSEGTDLWVCNDLWNMPAFPGHSPEALRSSLLTSYWLGASHIYVENLDSSGTLPRHPTASPKGSLIHWLDNDHYELTAHGRVVQDVYKHYIPTHPRTTNWRDYRPRVAFIRLPDGDWGQKGTWYRDQLLGNPRHPSDEASREWLHVWPVLTHGAVKDGAICVQNSAVYPEWKRPVFMPVDSVAVFDHLVQGPVLDSVGCFIVCGHALSKPTFKDVSRRVKAGATCIIARRLYEQYAKGATLPGDWLIVDDFKDPAITAKLQPFLGPADVARFRFKDQVIEFRPGKVADSVTVSVISRK